MRALNTIGRPILTGEATISGTGVEGPVDLGALFSIGDGDLSVASSGRVAGATNNPSIVTKPSRTVQLSDGTSIAFSSVDVAKHQIA